MAMPPHLLPLVTAHLTETETQFLLSVHFIPNHLNINWDELFMSLSICCYGIQHHLLSTSFLASMLKTAPYDAFILPAILQQQQCLLSITTLEDIVLTVIGLHRPLPILALMLEQYNTVTNTKREWCAFAASSNNVDALEWLRDPHTGDGRCFWSDWTCAMAAEQGHIDMLQRLRDPMLDGGICPWDTCACLHAVKTGQLATLVWLRNPNVGGGVCPWEKMWCLIFAQQYKHTAIAEWISAQPDDE
jgi:hypothetical protein